VHLVGLRSDGRLWVQQRSWHKPNDPGLWDTLVGGTVSAGETLAQTLERETWEEAGLRLADLSGLTLGGRFTASRPVPDGGGAGYLMEDTHWFTVTVPDGLEPRNQDGEVDHFEAWTPAEVAQALSHGRFTPEARWVLAETLARAMA
jgi:8-oxo-dGTP pyrophosphatase MutT (NUDIX family)